MGPAPPAILLEIEAVLQLRDETTAIAEMEHVCRPCSACAAETLRLQAVDLLGARTTQRGRDAFDSCPVGDR